MAIIVVTTDGQTVAVKNGDTVVVDIPGGGTVNIVAANTNVKTFRVDLGGDDTVSDTVNIDLSTFSSYGLHIDINNYDSNDVISLGNAFATHVDAGNEDEYNFSYIGSTGATFDGYIRAKDKGEQDFTASPSPVVVCFCQGTFIETATGPVPVETLRVGDLIKTRDHGKQPIRWIGKRVLDSLELARHPNLRPVRFDAGSLGGGLPFQELQVSPQHRIFLADWRTELHFGEREMLAPAIGFINNRSIAVQTDAAAVTYIHLLFDEHEIITANGVASESLHTGEMALASMSDEAREELHLILPHAPTNMSTNQTARPVARKNETIAALNAA